MPIDNRKVLSNISVPEMRDENGKVVSQRRILTEAEADEITSLFDQQRLDAFVKDGVLSGDWKSTKKAVAKANQPADK